MSSYPIRVKQENLRFTAKIAAMTMATMALSVCFAHGQVLPVVTTTLKKQQGYQVERTYTGRVTAKRKSTLGFESGGKLAQIWVDVGDKVNKGATLARLNIQVLTAQKELAQARLVDALAQKQNATAQNKLQKLNLARKKILLTQGHISQAQYDRDKAQAEAAGAQNKSATAAIAIAKANLKQSKARLELAVIKAPYNGSITNRFMDEGSVLRPGQAVLELVESGTPEVYIGLPAEVGARLSKMQTYTIVVAQEDFSARLKNLTPTVDPATRTVVAIFTLENTKPAKVLKNGTLARLKINRTYKKDGYWVPITALTESTRGLWAVYVLTAPQEDKTMENNEDSAAITTVNPRQVEVHHTKDNQAFIRGTVEDGDQIIVSGTHRLSPGQKVTVLQETKSTP